MFHVPFPDTIFGTPQRATQACFTVFQCLALCSAVGVDGQNHVEEDDLQQAVIERLLFAIAEQAAQHFRQIQTIGTQIPLKIHTDALVHEPHQQTITHVVSLVRTAP